MEIPLILLRIMPSIRPHTGDIGFTAEFSQPIVSLKKTSEGNPREARLVISQEGQPKTVLLPYETRLVVNFTDQEWEEIRDKMIVGKEYFIKTDKNKLVLEFSK